LFNEDLTLRKPTPNERLELSMDPDVTKLQLFIRSLPPRELEAENVPFPGE
jgi:hypothetical protein